MNHAASRPLTESDKAELTKRLHALQVYEAQVRALDPRFAGEMVSPPRLHRAPDAAAQRQLAWCANPIMAA
ncbi:MAG: hypothetical protein ACI9MR_005140 [Myxococcota bacterium]|jgi:hypothetical protein